MKKKKFRFSHLYLAVVMAITYLPLVMVVIFSFNDSKLTVSWKGFTLSWYQKLFQDAALIAALKNSLILGVVSCLVAAVIGTLGAIGMARVNYKSKGMMEYLSTVPIMVPEIILGMVFMAFFSLLKFLFQTALFLFHFLSFHNPFGKKRRANLHGVLTFLLLITTCSCIRGSRCPTICLEILTQHISLYYRSCSVIKTDL